VGQGRQGLGREAGVNWSKAVSQQRALLETEPFPIYRAWRTLCCRGLMKIDRDGSKTIPIYRDGRAAATDSGQNGVERVVADTVTPFCVRDRRR
jgi:hypothetical protein